MYALAKDGYYDAHDGNFKKRISEHRGEKKWLGKSQQLQTELKWENEVLISQIADFVKVYTEYRIVVITNLVLKSSRHTDWSGVDYQPDCNKNIIYLYYNLADRHYSAISSIKEFVTMKGGSYKWCVACSTYYQSTTALQNCSCDLLDEVPKEKKRPLCSKCNECYSLGSKHICGHQVCHYCHLAFKTDSDEMLKHRCPVFMTSTTKPTTFLGDAFMDEYDNEDDTDDDSYQKPPYSLWVYDLESSLVPVEGTIPQYVLDDDGYLQKEENGQSNQIQQMWVDKLKIFLADESTLDEEVMDLDDGPVEFGTAVPVIQIAVNPQPNHPTPAVPPVKQRRLGLARRALASRPVN